MWYAKSVERLSWDEGGLLVFWGMDGLNGLKATRRGEGFGDKRGRVSEAAGSAGVCAELGGDG